MKKPAQGPSKGLLSVHIGTAGWSIASRYTETMPAGGTHLERYGRRLCAVEINSSFHRHHRMQTYERWAASVPNHFRFSVKTPRALTHDGELSPAPEVLDQFAAEIRGLGGKLAVLLVQLPPRLAFDEKTATRFFNALRKRVSVQLACEPRHASWGSPRADEVLAKRAVARVAADPAPWPGADQPGGCREFAYFRWHGQPRKYYSDYDAGQLRSLREQVIAARREAADVWAIFDNTALGYALGNALALAKSLPPTPSPRRRRSRRGTAACGRSSGV